MIPSATLGRARQIFGAGDPEFDAHLRKLSLASAEAKRAYLQGGEPGPYDTAVGAFDAGQQQAFETGRGQFMQDTTPAPAPYYPNTQPFADTGMGGSPSSYGPRYAAMAGPGAQDIAAGQAEHLATVAEMNPENAARAAVMALPGTGNDLTWKPETMKSIQNDSSVKRLVAGGQVTPGRGLNVTETARGIVSEKFRAGQLGGQVGDTWVGSGAADIIPKPLAGQFQAPAEVAGMTAPDPIQLDISGRPQPGQNQAFQVVQRGPDEATQLKNQGRRNVMLDAQAEGQKLKAGGDLAAMAPQAAQAGLAMQQQQVESGRMANELAGIHLAAIKANPQAYMQQMNSANVTERVQMLTTLAQAATAAGNPQMANTLLSAAGKAANNGVLLPQDLTTFEQILQWLAWAGSSVSMPGRPNPLPMAGAR